MGHDASERTVSGSCLCRGVRFELTPPFPQASYCHCEYCRKHSGNFGSIAVEVPREHMRLLAGEELLEPFRLAPGLTIRVFCRRCGSPIYGTDEPESETVWVRLGALDADPGVRLSRHTGVDSAPAWLPVPDDGLPRFPQRADGRPYPIVASSPRPASEEGLIPASCLCGDVRLELEPPFLMASYCHCEHCRKHSGNFGSGSIDVPRKQMRILSGEELLGRFQPAPGLAVKVFCTRCGSSLYGTDEPESETVWVRIGALDADPGLRPSRHVFVRSAPAWLPVPEDGLPSYETWPPT
jgi:hypothetical protein